MAAAGELKCIDSSPFRHWQCIHFERGTKKRDQGICQTKRCFCLPSYGDIAITFPAQLLSFRACFRAEIAQQSSVSQFAKMLIVDYHSVTYTFGEVCTALLLLLTSVTVATAEWSFSKLKLIKTYLSSMGQERLNGLAILSIERAIMHYHFYVWKASFGLQVCFASGCAQSACRSWRSDFAPTKLATSYRLVTW